MATTDWVNAQEWQWGVDYARTPGGTKSFTELLRNHIRKNRSWNLSYTVQVYKLSPEQEEIDEIKTKMAMDPKAMASLMNDVESAAQKLAKKVMEDRRVEELRIEKGALLGTPGALLGFEDLTRTRARAYDSTQRGNIVTNAGSNVRIYRKRDACPDMRPEWAKVRYFANDGDWCGDVAYSPKGVGGGWVVLSELPGVGRFPIEAYGELVEELRLADFTIPRYTGLDAPWSKTGKADPVDRWPTGRCMLLVITAAESDPMLPWSVISDYLWRGVPAVLLDSSNQWWSARRLPNGRVAVVEALPHPRNIIARGQIEATRVLPVPLPDLSIRGLRWTYRSTLGIRKAGRESFVVNPLDYPGTGSGS